MTASSGPIFVGGLDKSGKTLMRLSLSAHPNISMTRRTYTWTDVYDRFGDLAQPTNFERCLAAMLRNRHMAVLQPDPERIRREFWQGAPTYGRLFALFHQHYAERVGKPRWGDQLGQVEYFADRVIAAYPDARIIHMLRDPRNRYAAATDPTQRRIGQVGMATARWLASAEVAQRNSKRYPGAYLLVRYEALLANREQTLRAVCAFIGEAFVPAMLTLEGAMRFGNDDEPSDAAPRRRSEAGLSLREIAFVQAYASGAMLRHDYQPQPVHLALAARVRFFCVDWPANLARAAAWRRWEARRLTDHASTGALVLNKGANHD